MQATALRRGPPSPPTGKRKNTYPAEQERRFTLAEMFGVLDVGISDYRAWTRGGKPDRWRLTDSQMLAPMLAIHAELKIAYGSRRMVRDLRAQGFSASKERVHGTRYATHAGINVAAFEYIEVFYNPEWQHLIIGHKATMPFLAVWLSRLHQEKRGT